MDRGHGQLEVGPGQAGNDLPGERHVVGQRGVPVRGPQQQGEGELRGAAAGVSPPEALRGVGSDGQRFRWVEAPAGEVDLAGRAHALHEVGKGTEGVAEHGALLAVCELDQDLVERSGPSVVDVTHEGHPLAGEQRLVAYPASPKPPCGAVTPACLIRFLSARCAPP